MRAEPENTDFTPLSPHPGPGKLIVICGNDGVGKTTMLELTEAELRRRGHDVLRTRQPTGEARNFAAHKLYIYHPERRSEIDFRALQCLMIGDRLQHLHQVVKPALEAGKIVLCDRYIFTQMVTTRTRGFVDEPWIHELYRHVVKPDLGIVLDSPMSIVAERIRGRDNDRAAFLEWDHAQRNLEEFRRIAAAYDLAVVDTSSPDPAVAFAVITELLDTVLADYEQTSGNTRPARAGAA